MEEENELDILRFRHNDVNFKAAFDDRQTPKNVHKMCFWAIWRTFKCDLIIDLYFNFSLLMLSCFLGGLSLHLNHLIASCMANYDWPFGTLPFGLFCSNLDTRDLETYPRTYSGYFWNMSIFDDSRAVWVLFRKWVVSENQSFLNEGAIVTPLSV